MKQILSGTIVFTLLVVWGCGKQEAELTPQQIQERADSIVNSKMKALKQHAKDDLAKRLPIEVKPKMDSMRNAEFEPASIPVFPDEDNTTDKEDE